jgi:UDP-glucose 4-epimerase
MRIVVVGATGNVGTSLLQALADEPAVTSVLGLARRRPEWTAPKTERATADVAGDGDLVTHFRGADVVVHLAWVFQPTHDPVATWRINVGGTVRVLDAVTRAGVPAFVCASSVAAYSPGPKDRRVDESWPTHGWPTAGYTREKAYVERLLDVFEKDSPDRRVVRLRSAFIFKRESAAQQRRLFAGPLLPARLARPGLVPFVPDLPGLRFQAMHSQDAAEAYRLAIVRPVRGAFNLAADPVIDPQRLAELLDARTVPVPVPVARSILAAAWHLHLVPAAPTLFDVMLGLPLLDTGRARTELGWSPRHSSMDALRELLDGLRDTAGMATPPLQRRAGGQARWREFRTGLVRRHRDRDRHAALAPRDGSG